MNFIEKIDNIISKISKSFLIGFFSILIVVMLIISSIYLYIDKPSFQLNNLNNYIGIILNIVLVLGIIYVTRKLSNKIKNYKLLIGIIFLIYFILELVYIFMVPIRPFSDMGEIVKIAMSDFTENIEYLQIYPNNFFICVIFNLLFRITSYNVLNLKIFNIICNIVTIIFAYKIYKNIYKKDNLLVVLLGAFSISTFLYVNCTYNDLLFTTIVTIVIFCLTKEKQDLTNTIIIFILLFLQYIVRPVGIILIIATCMYYLLKEKNITKILVLLSIVLVLNFGYKTIQHKIIPKSTEEVPIWSFLQMGINEEEFGFQDSSHSPEWTFNDYKDRIEKLGIIRILKIIVKKVIWTWTEGTYQVERYAFGSSLNNQYYYDTALTAEVFQINSSIRISLEYFMKGQYLVLMILSLFGLIFSDKEISKNKIYLLFYIIIGMLCFYIIWEIKSRYIYCLYPIFLILAANGSERAIDKLKEGKIKWENLRKMKHQ